MSNIQTTIAVSNTEGNAGASSNVSTLAGRDRNFVYVGSAGDEIEIQVSNDNTNWARLTKINGASGVYSCNDRFAYVRSKRISGTTSASLVMNGAEEVNAAGPPGSPSFGSTTLQGTASTTDATATQIVSFTPGADGAYTLLVHLIGKKDDGTVYSAVFQASWKKVSGTLTAIAATKVSETTSSLDPGDATATAASGVAKFNVVGAASTNITWTAYGVLGTA